MPSLHLTSTSTGAFQDLQSGSAAKNAVISARAVETLLLISMYIRVSWHLGLISKVRWYLRSFLGCDHLARVLVIKLGTTNSSPKCHCESVLEAVFQAGFLPGNVFIWWSYTKGFLGFSNLGNLFKSTWKTKLKKGYLKNIFDLFSCLTKCYFSVPLILNSLKEHLKRKNF